VNHISEWLNSAEEKEVDIIAAPDMMPKAML
jgi:hypothetical protein